MREISVKDIRAAVNGSLRLDTMIMQEEMERKYHELTNVAFRE